MLKLTNLGRTTVHRVLPTVLLCGFAFCGTLASESIKLPAPATLYQIASLDQKLEFPDTDSIAIEFPDWLTRITNPNPEVIHVTALTPSVVRIHRRSHGKTTLRAIDRGNREYAVELTIETMGND